MMSEVKAAHSLVMEALQHFDNIEGCFYILEPEIPEWMEDFLDELKEAHPVKDEFTIQFLYDVLLELGTVLSFRSTESLEDLEDILDDCWFEPVLPVQWLRSHQSRWRYLRSAFEDLDLERALAEAQWLERRDILYFVLDFLKERTQTVSSQTS